MLRLATTSLLLLLLHASQPAEACAATSVKEIVTKIVNGKLAAIRCSDIKGVLGSGPGSSGSLLDPTTYIECLPGKPDSGCTGGAACSGFRCSCPDGLVYVGALGCTDVNECALPGFQPCLGPANSFNCVNLQGFYLCNCTKPGQLYNPKWGCADSPECKFPFTYRDKMYSSCTSVGRSFLWCGLTENVDRDDKWVVCPLAYGTTHCVFPTRYNGVQTSGCFVDPATGRRLCSLTNNYDADRKSELCMEVA